MIAVEVILVAGQGFLPKLIMKLTRGRVSHAALRYSGAESNWLIHSTIGGVQPDWWFYFKQRYPLIYRFRTKFAGADAAADAVVKRLAHADYDYPGLIGQGIAIVTGMKTNPWGSGVKFRCTELIVAWHAECNAINPDLDLLVCNPEMIDPQMLDDYYRTRGDLFDLVMGDE